MNIDDAIKIVDVAIIITSSLAAIGWITLGICVIIWVVM